jgi:hypothetical protein
VEDRPLSFKVGLPDGMAIRGSSSGAVVGGPGIRYRYRWRLLDADGEILRETTQTSDKSSANWVTASFVEPYSRRFLEKLVVEVRVTYLDSLGNVLQSARSRFRIPRIQDVTPPLTQSMGDEEEYVEFYCHSLSVQDGGIATTTDRLRGEDGVLLPRSPYRAILDDGATLEQVPGPELELSKGTLEFEWGNVYDNLAPPFTGPDYQGLGRFGLYLIPSWDLGASHHLVSGSHRPHMQATREVIREPDGTVELYLIDLSDQLGPPPEEGGSWGRGKVRIPLPYDRVGDLEVGFYAEDRAWPSPNHVRKGRFRFRIVDDISPTLVFSIRKVREHKSSWITADSVNHRWTTSETSFSLPDKFGGQPFSKVAGLSVKVQTPYIFQVMAFDNTRLARTGMKVRLRGPEDTSGFGMLIPGRKGRVVEWDLPVDGFDPSLSRTPRQKVPRLFFGIPGHYRLTFEIEDVQGNRTLFEIPLEAGEREVDWIRLSEESRRVGGGR